MVPIETLSPVLEYHPELINRWSKEKATQWFEKNGWMVGCNYIPSTAINQLEMWQAESFDPFIIDKELSWAASLGFNTIRVFLHHLLWEHDASSFINRIEQFLSIADKYGIKTMFVLFDAVWDPFPKLGKQPEPRKNVHNSGWVQSPGFEVLNNRDSYDSLHSYVHGIISHFKDDSRILIWDLFNEPDNMNVASYKDDNYAIHKAELSMQLLKKAFIWARAINPIQPLTAAPWNWENMDTLTMLDKYMFSCSDIITFHNYEKAHKLRRRIIEMKKLYDRPMMCTEFMARPLGSTFEGSLSVMKKYNVGAYCWGLVAGKTQTHCAWNSWETEEAAEPGVWFHDIFHANGEPYNTQEVTFLKEITKKPVTKKYKRVA